MFSKAQRTKLGLVTAFSLLELMVVVATIAILAALFLPALMRSKRRAQQIQCVNNLGQQGLALGNFVSEFGGYPTWAGTVNLDMSGRQWMEQLEVGGFGDANPAANFYQQGYWRCPAAATRISPDSGVAFYGYNVMGLLSVDSPDHFGLGGHWGDPGAVKPIKDAEVVKPSEMAAIADCDQPEFRRNLAYDYSRLKSRHGNRVDLVHCDGHVEMLTSQFLFTGIGDTALARWNRDHLPHRDRL